MNNDLEKLEVAQQEMAIAIDALRSVLKASNPLIVEMFLEEIAPLVKVKQKLERVISLIE